MSRAACDPIRERLAFDFEDLGEQRVKNISRPIQVFGVRIEGAEAPVPCSAKEPSAAPMARLSARPKWVGRSLGVLVIALTLAVAAVMVSRLTAVSPRGVESARTEPNQIAAAAQPTASPPLKCNGSDEEIIRPVKALYQAVNGKNIDRYAAQWSDDAVYVDATTGKTRPKAEKIANRRSQFALWEWVNLTMDHVMVIERSEEHALVRVTYSMTVKPVGRPTLSQNWINQYYDTVCASDGRWLIQRNVDEKPLKTPDDGTKTEH